MGLSHRVLGSAKRLPSLTNTARRRTKPWMAAISDGEKDGRLSSPLIGMTGQAFSGQPQVPISLFCLPVAPKSNLMPILTAPGNRV